MNERGEECCVTVLWRDLSREMTVATVYGREAAVAEAQRLSEDLGGDATRVQALLIPVPGRVAVGGVLWEWPAREEERVESGPAHLSVHLAHASERDLMSVRQWLQGRFGQGQVEVHTSRPVQPIERMRQAVRVPGPAQFTAPSSPFGQIGDREEQA